MASSQLVHQPQVPVEVIPDISVELVYCPERGALHPYSQPKPGALRIVDLGGGYFISYPIDAAGVFHTYDEDRFRTPLEFVRDALRDMKI